MTCLKIIGFRNKKVISAEICWLLLEKHSPENVPYKKGNSFTDPTLASGLSKTQLKTFQL